MTTRIGSADLEAARIGAVTADLGPASAVRLVGRDARRFSNGMFTNNIRDLRPGEANRSAIVDDRGRIGGFLDALCEGDDTFLLVLDGIDVAAFVARYEKFVVFDDVTITPVDARRRSVQGPRAAEALAAARLEVPSPGAWTGLEATRIWPYRRSPAGGFDLLLAPSSDPGAPHLSAHPVDADAAEVLRVLGGRPAFPADTGDKRLPHELGLRDELLSFDKGCYLGQETINRLDVMGQVRRRLAGIRFDSTDAPPVGAEVRHGDQAVGELTSPVLLPDGAAALAVLRLPADTPGTVVRAVSGDRSWDGVVSSLPFEVVASPPSLPGS